MTALSKCHSTVIPMSLLRSVLEYPGAAPSGDDAAGQAVACAGHPVASLGAPVPANDAFDQGRWRTASHAELSDPADSTRRARRG